MTGERGSNAVMPAVATAEAKLAALAGALRTNRIVEPVAWECNRLGQVVWTGEGDGLSPGAPLGDFASGSPLATAFARRAPFRALDSGQGWRLNAVPFFRSGDGAFLGFRGTATPVPKAPASLPDLFQTGASVEAFAHMAHEVRTPLTAIMGFAQMIEAETLGAANAEYCERASAIVDSATRLLDAVDDLADASQLEQGRYAIGDGSSDLDQLLHSLVDRFRKTAARCDVTLQLVIAGPLRAAAVEERLLSRAMDRLLSALLAVAARESLTIGARSSGDAVEVIVSRPAALDGLSSVQLLNPAERIETRAGPGPILGMGFGLRLAASLIEASGGRFAIEPDLLRLTIPGIAKRERIA